MQSLVLENYGTVEMNQNELSTTDGGFVPLLIIGAASLVSGCSRKIYEHLEKGDYQKTHSQSDSTHVHGAGGSY
jgi:hypothetical protein